MLLAALAPQRTSEHVDDTTLFKRLAEVPIELIVLDAELLDVAGENVLKRIETTSPATRCLILAETVRRQEELKRLDGEHVLLQGTSAAEIAITIEQLLSTPRRDS